LAIDRNKTSQSAEKLVAQGKIEAAIEIFEKLVKDNPRDMNTINKIGDLYSRLGRRGQAIEQFCKIGDFYTKEGFVLKAIAIYKKIHKLDPAHLLSNERLADLYLKQGLLPEARAQYRTAADRYTKAGDAAGALRITRELVNLEPEDLGTRERLADLLAQAGETQEAVDVLLELGEELDKKGMKKESGVIYARIDELQPAAPALVARMARTQAASGDRDGAVERVQSALEAAPGDADLLLLLADLHSESGSPQQALDAVGRACQANPDRLDLFCRLSRLHLAGGDASLAYETLAPHTGRMIKEEQTDEAVALLGEILDVDISHRGALQRLEEVRRARGEEKEAVECMQRLLDLAMEDENYDEALPIAEVLLERRPGDESIKLKLELVRKARSKATTPEVAVSNEGGEDRLEVEDVGASAGAEIVLEDGPVEPGPPARPAAVGSMELPAPAELTPEDQDFITEHMTEADVFVKYGLSDRAVEQLATVTQQFPSYVPAHLKLKEIYLEEGNRIAAREEMAILVKAHLAASDAAAATEAYEELVRFDPACPEIEPLGAALGRGPAPAPVEAAVDAPSDIIVEEEPSEPSPDALAKVDEHLAALEKEAAVDLLRGLAEQFGSHPAIVSRMKTALALQGLKAASAQQGGEPTEQAAPARPAAQEEEVEEFEIDLDDEEVVEVDEPVAAETASPPSPPAEAQPAGMLDDLSDLASEIEQALAGVGAEADESIVAGKEASPEAESLEEIVQAFKQGVEQQLGENDHETHYNLGIAYKEMGLVDDAIGEFQAASKEPGFLLDSCLMLGVCFREKGMPALAEKWYRRGMDSGEDGEEEKSLGVRYDLADLMQETDRREEALHLFTEIFGINSKFRDVAERIRRLEQGES